MIKRIGLSTTWQESCFLAYGGLRGAVGISLAISLDNSVWTYTENETYRRKSTQLFGMIGGTAFLTLVINGSTAGPLLKKLGLAKSTVTRKKILGSIETEIMDNSIHEFISLLRDKRFSSIRVSHCLQYLDVTEDAVLEQYNKQVPGHSKCNSLEDVLTQLHAADTDVEVANSECQSDRNNGKVDVDVLKELRCRFIEILRWAYQKQIKNGELDGRQAFLAYRIQSGLDFAADYVSKGEAVEDWLAAQIITGNSIYYARSWTRKLYTLNGLICKTLLPSGVPSGEFEIAKYKVKLAVSVIEAHRVADEHFRAKVAIQYPNEAQQVLRESKKQTELAEKSLEVIDPDIVRGATEHLLVIIILNKRSRYIEGLLTSGLLSEKEAQVYIGDIETHLNAIFNADM